ncbi:MAG: polysaccharide biosynthesis tyrosine autokinase [Gammaproteobacteria bacterium]|nr:polysaccharide biosynthesis tyrosine autokinase [Gammaproteobacteria bacterium]
MDDYWDRGDGSEWVRGFFDRLRRGKSIILAVSMLGTLAALTYIWQATPRYSAKAMILVGVPKQHVIDVEEVLQGIRTDRATLESEIEVLTSRSLAAKVVDKLGLVDEPAYNPRLRPPRRSILAMLNPLNWIPREWRSALGGGDAAPEEPASEEERARRIRGAVTGAVMGSVSARIEGRSRVIALTARSTEPELSAAVANTLSELYLVEQLEMKFEATQRAADWLNTRVDELREQVEASERVVEDYRQQHGLVRSNDTTVAEQQISGATTQLIAARAKTAEAEARLRQTRSLLEGGRVESASDVLASPVIQKLREQETGVARQVAEMATVYGPRHPSMINIRAELDEVRGKLDAEVEKVVSSLENELEVARIRERTLNGDLDRLKSDAERINAAQGRLRVLEREAAANRTLFDTFLGRWKETGRQDEIQYADARILSPAAVPRAPSSPQTVRIVGAALALSLVLGIALVYLVEQLDNGFRGAEQIERMTGLGVLSVVPKVPTSRQPETGLRGYQTAKPASSFAESFRTLYTGLQLSAGAGDGKKILVTSSIPGEGKTTVAIGLGQMLAQLGHRVLLIDADLRRNQMAEFLNLESKERSLERYFASEDATFSEVVQRDESSGMDVIVSGGQRIPNSADLLRSQRLSDLVAACDDKYDHVIIDSPPTQMLSDSRLVAGLADQTIFVIRWVDVRREVALSGLKQLAKATSNIAGVVLNAADMRRSAGYGYYNYGYGYGYGYGRVRQYSRYYQD